MGLELSSILWVQPYICVQLILGVQAPVAPKQLLFQYLEWKSHVTDSNRKSIRSCTSYARFCGSNRISVSKPYVDLNCPWRQNNYSSRAEWKSHFAPAVDRQPWSPRGKLFHLSVASSPLEPPELTKCFREPRILAESRPVYQLHARIRSLQTRVSHGDLAPTSFPPKQIFRDLSW